MGHVKRKLPKDESAHFRLASNLESWNGIREGTSMREQENKIAFFNFRAPGEKFARNVRRDDFDCGSDGFICETNELTCKELLRDAGILSQGNVKDSARAFHRSKVGEYVRSLRKLANYCLLCRCPLKVQKSIIIDGRETEPETVEERKARLSVKKSVSTKYRAYGKRLKREHKFGQRSIIKYAPKGETVFSAKMGGQAVFYLATPQGQVANVEYLLKFKKVMLAEFRPQIASVPSLNEVCGCKKS